MPVKRESGFEGVDDSAQNGRLLRFAQGVLVQLQLSEPAADLRPAIPRQQRSFFEGRAPAASPERGPTNDFSEDILSSIGQFGEAVGVQMFELELSTQRSGLTSKAVVDKDRQIRLVRVAGNGPLPGDAFVLAWDGRSIPFDTDTNQVEDEVGEIYYRTTFGMFGGSPSAKNAVGVLPFAFSGPEERNAALLLVVEALLVYGSNYDGLGRPDGYYRVQALDREWRLSDFDILRVEGDSGT